MKQYKYFPPHREKKKANLFFFAANFVFLNKSESLKMAPLKKFVICVKLVFPQYCLSLRLVN